DLSKAVVVASPGLSGPGKKAVEMLVDEVYKRTQIRWRVVQSPPSGDGPAIQVSDEKSASHGKEGYRLRVLKVGTRPAVVSVAGNDERGVLFGVGRLLREL